MRCTECTPIDDDAENTGIRPLEACVSLSIEGIGAGDKRSIPIQICSLQHRSGWGYFLEDTDQGKFAAV